MHCFLLLFFFNDTATTEIYTLSLHDALPISFARFMALALYDPRVGYYCRDRARVGYAAGTDFFTASTSGPIFGDRKSTRLNSSHQIISYAVFCLKKKRKVTNTGVAVVTTVIY